MITIFAFITLLPWNLGLAEIVGLLTLFATLGAIYWAWKTYKHQVEMIEPWALTKVGENLWRLERKLPKLATIRGLVDGVLCDSYQVSWLNSAGVPCGYFKNGTNILLRINNPAPGAVFEIHYEEHKKERYPFVPQFIDDIKLKDYETYPKTWKKWTTTIY